MKTVRDVRTLKSYTRTYDPAGNLAQKSYPNGLDTAFGYDPAGRMTSLDTVRGGQTIASYALSYDPAGNRTSITLPQPQGGPDLSLSTLSVYWASYQDWLDHELSIDYRITENGPGTAFEAKVTNSTATNGVYLTTAMPLSLVEINEGSFADFTLKYYICHQQLTSSPFHRFRLFTFLGDRQGNPPCVQNISIDAMNNSTDKKPASRRFPCHCCHKQGVVYWSEKRQSFICENCLKTFNQEIIAKRNGMAVEQLSFC